MPNLEIALPAAIGDAVVLTAGTYAGQVVLVTGWRVVRRRCALGGALDPPLQVTVAVITRNGVALWLDTSEVAGTGAMVRVVLPFMAGDPVLVRSIGARGEVVGWTVTGRRLGVEMVYRVHLAGTPAGDELEVAVHDLESRLRA